MKITIKKIETFGQGIEAYRIVPEKKGETRGDRSESESPIKITANATRLGQQLHEQLLCEREVE